MGSTLFSLRWSQTQTTLQAIDRRFGGEVEALISEPRHQLLGPQMRVARTPQHRDDLRLFDQGECIAWATMWAASTILAAGPVAPAFNGSSRDADDPTGLGKTSTAGLGLTDGGED